METNLSKNLRFLRGLKGFTQSELGEELGMTRASIDAYEAGRAVPPYAKLKFLADYFESSVEALTETDMEDSYAEEIGRNGLDDLSSLPIFAVQQEPSNLKKDNLAKGIPLISAYQFEQYLNDGFRSISDDLITISLPGLSEEDHLAFESSNDFPLPKSVLIGKRIKDVSRLVDNKCYLVVSPTQGILYRRAYNQIKLRGVLVLTPEINGLDTFDLELSQIKEVWEVVAYISYEMPQQKPSLENAKELAKKLQQELDRLV